MRRDRSVEPMRSREAAEENVCCYFVWEAPLVRSGTERKR